MATSKQVLALALVQPLHGITFALLHLAIYGTVGIGGATALATFSSGSLYGRLGAAGFWVMALVCAGALPLVWRLARSSALH